MGEAEPWHGVDWGCEEWKESPTYSSLRTKPFLLYLVSFWLFLFCHFSLFFQSLGKWTQSKPFHVLCQFLFGGMNNEICGGLRFTNSYGRTQIYISIYVMDKGDCVGVVCKGHSCSRAFKHPGQSDVYSEGPCRDQICSSVSMCRPNVVVNVCLPITGEVEAGSRPAP